MSKSMLRLLMKEPLSSEISIESMWSKNFINMFKQLERYGVDFLHIFSTTTFNMDLEELDQLKATLRKLPPATQDSLAGLLLIERLKRNQLVMPDLHKRIEDADPENWQKWEKTKEDKKKNPIDV